MSNRIAKLLIILVIGAVVMYLRQKTIYSTLQAVWDGIIPILTCYLIHAYLGRIPAINSLLSFIGKHSMNIFLIHNFIRILWYYDFTYSFRYWWLITIVLLTISILLSILVEQLKKFIKYNEAVTWLVSKCDSL